MLDRYFSEPPSGGPCRRGCPPGRALNLAQRPPSLDEGLGASGVGFRVRV